MERAKLASERVVVGEPGDLVDEPAVPARPRASSVMFSLRIDRGTFEALSDLADRQGRRFSDTARDALRAYVDRSGEDRLQGLVEAIATKLGVDATDVYPERSAAPGHVQARERTPVSSWTDDELERQLQRYEQICRDSGMQEKAIHSYWDYARRFLAWRRGEYWPRGTVSAGRPVPRTPATAANLKAQAAAYAAVVEAAGRERPTVETYLRHAMFFIRWLDGDFIPGARLSGH